MSNEHEGVTREDIIAEYERGDSLIDLAEKYGVSKTTMWKYLKKWGVKIRPARKSGTFLLNL